LKPQYEPNAQGNDVQLTLRLTDNEYEQEYVACRQNLPDELSVNRALLDSLPSPIVPSGLEELVRRRVVLDLPARYY
jgi:hypothetical protein